MTNAPPSDRDVRSDERHTPGPWPWKYTGDGKRIVIGEGLVEGPGGYEVAEVYSDDCPAEVAEANARLIAAAPDLLEALQRMHQAFNAKAPIPKQEGDALEAMCRAAIAKATKPDIRDPKAP